MDDKQITALVGTTVADAITGADIGKQVSDAVAGLNIGQTIADAISAKAKTDADDAQAKIDAAAKQTQLDEQGKKTMDARIALHVDLKSILSADEYDASKTDKELIVLAVGDSVENADSKSDEYLTEKVAEIAKDRASVSDKLISDAASDAVSLKLTAL